MSPAATTALSSPLPLSVNTFKHAGIPTATITTTNSNIGHGPIHHLMTLRHMSLPQAAASSTNDCYPIDRPASKHGKRDSIDWNSELMWPYTTAYSSPDEPHTPTFEPSHGASHSRIKTHLLSSPASQSNGSFNNGRRMHPDPKMEQTSPSSLTGASSLPPPPNNIPSISPRSSTSSPSSRPSSARRVSDSPSTAQTSPQPSTSTSSSHRRRCRRPAAHNTSRRSSQSQSRQRKSAAAPAGSPGSYGSYRRLSSPLYRTSTTPAAVDMEAAIAIHQRCCAVFRNTSFSTPANSPGRPGTAASPHDSPLSGSPLMESKEGGSGHGLSELFANEKMANRPVPGRSASCQEAGLALDLEKASRLHGGPERQQYYRAEDADADADPAAHVPPVIIHWTSPATRAREYAEIDRWTTGLRGALRKVAPRWFFRHAMLKFHDASREDASDAGSVRRYRLDVEDEEGLVELAAPAKKKKSTRPTFQRSLSCF